MIPGGDRALPRRMVSSAVRDPLRAALLLAAALEAATCVARFGFGLRASRDTAALGAFTGGLRIHHGYAGAVLLLCAAFPRMAAPARALLLAAGGGLLASDLVHHLVVLRLATGSAQFDLSYR